MDKKYTIRWYNLQKTVLMVEYIAIVGWDDILEAHNEASNILQEMSHEVILFHNGGESPPASMNVGSIHDQFYNRLPRPPKNLKFVLVLLGNPGVMRPFDASLEVLDKVFFKRKYTYVVGTMAEAEKVIAKAGF